MMDVVVSLMQADLKGPSISERDKHSCCLGIFHERKTAPTSTYKVTEAEAVNDHVGHNHCKIAASYCTCGCLLRL